MSNKVGRIPSPSMKKITAGHGPEPAGRNTEVGHAPSRVSIVTRSRLMFGSYLLGCASRPAADLAPFEPGPHHPHLGAVF